MRHSIRARLPRHPAASGIVSLTLASSLVTMAGCQFFFPTPIEGHVDDAKPASIVRSFGVPYRAGELIKADVFFDSVLAGRGELRAGAPCLVGTKTVIPVSTSGESTGLARMLQTAKSETAGLVDVDSGLPIAARSDSRIGDEHRLAEVLLGKSIADIRYVRYLDEGPKSDFQEITLPIEQTPHDGHSAIGYLRNWRPEPGTHGFLYAVFGHFPWKADLVFVGKETLHTDHGDTKAVRIDGVATKLVGKILMPSEQTPKRPFTMWFSDDDRRAPLRILVETQIAKVTIELTEYSRIEPPTKALEPCKPLFDEKALRTGVADELKRRQQKGTSDKSDDEQKEEKDAIERLLKSPN